MNERKCCKYLGILGVGSECPKSCVVIQEVRKQHDELQKGRAGEVTDKKASSLREQLDLIAVEVSDKHCPSGVELVLPKGSVRLM